MVLTSAVPVGAGLVVTCPPSYVAVFALLSTGPKRVNVCRWWRMTASCSIIGARARISMSTISAGASCCVNAIPGAGSVLGR